MARAAGVRSSGSGGQAQGAVGQPQASFETICTVTSLVLINLESDQLARYLGSDHRTLVANLIIPLPG